MLASAFNRCSRLAQSAPSNCRRFVVFVNSPSMLQPPLESPSLLRWSRRLCCSVTSFVVAPALSSAANSPNSSACSVLAAESSMRLVPSSLADLQPRCWCVTSTSGRSQAHTVALFCTQCLFLPSFPKFLNAKGTGPGYPQAPFQDQLLPNKFPTVTFYDFLSFLSKHKKAPKSTTSIQPRLSISQPHNARRN